MAEKRIVCFLSKKWKYVVFYISNNYYIYLKRLFEIIVTNDCFSIFRRSAALRAASLFASQHCLQWKGGHLFLNNGIPFVFILFLYTTFACNAHYIYAVHNYIHIEFYVVIWEWIQTLLAELSIEVCMFIAIWTN